MVIRWQVGQLKENDTLNFEITVHDISNLETLCFLEKIETTRITNRKSLLPNRRSLLRYQVKGKGFGRRSYVDNQCKRVG